MEESVIPRSRRTTVSVAAAFLVVPLSAAPAAQAAPGPWSDPVTVLRSDPGFAGNLHWRLHVTTGDGGQVLVSTVTQIDDDSEGQLAYRAAASGPDAGRPPAHWGPVGPLASTWTAATLSTSPGRRRPASSE